MTEQRRGFRSVYKGIRFRSKLECDWARAFDALGVEWLYEPEGRYWGDGDVYYMPDFWLPHSRQHVEVKAIFEPADCKKIIALLEHVEPRPHTIPGVCPDFPIIAAFPDGNFYGWERRDYPPQSTFEALAERAKLVALMQCRVCNHWWFGDDDENRRCQCCGAWQFNDQHVRRIMTRPIRPWPLSPNTAA